MKKDYKRPIPHAMGGRSHDSGLHSEPSSKLSLITDGRLGMSSLLSGRVYIVSVVALVSLAPKRRVCIYIFIGLLCVEASFHNLVVSRLKP